MLWGSQNPIESFTIADLHGAYVHVKSSKNPHHSGLTGIVLGDTRRRIHIVTPSNQFCGIEKKESIFELRVSNSVLLLNGSAL